MSSSQGKTMSGFPQTPKLKQFVFTDPVAFRYLEEDPTTVVHERHGILEGYQLYIVEQWACSRIHPTFIINTYTGDPHHRVIVGVLGVPADEDTWSTRLRLYFNATNKLYARLQETPFGILMVTNLNCFPSALTIIPVPDGDVKRHRYSFLVNENLKRLGCSGRSGISLSPPTGATQAKFFQLYKTSPRIPFYDAVIELVKLCQVALTVFGKLELEYADGCLCDITEVAIKEWWTEIGSEHYDTEPSDGVLGPTTVAGLLGMLIGARNRLSSYGAPVGKDAFDLYHLKRGIDHFQKSQKLKRTRRLDRHTLDRLHKITAKAASGEGWAVPKTVKSTVAELSGKGGEMVLGIVGRERPCIGDVETLIIDDFINLANGEKIKWLWHGKPKRGGSNETQSSPFARDDSATLIWSQSKSETEPVEEESEVRWKEEKSPPIIYSRYPPGSAHSIPDSPSDRDHLHRTVFKSVSGKMNDARNGLGRIKGAVGLRGYAHRHSKDESTTSGNSLLSSSLLPSSSYQPSPFPGNKISWKDIPARYQSGTPKHKESPSRSESQVDDLNPENFNGEYISNIQNSTLYKSAPHEKDAAWPTEYKKSDSTPLNKISFAGSSEEFELEHTNSRTEQVSRNYKFSLRRCNSISGGIGTQENFRNDNWWPRRISFSAAEDAILNWGPITSQNFSGKGNIRSFSSGTNDTIENLRRLLQILTGLQNNVKPWVEHNLSGVISIDENLLQDQDNLQIVYAQLMDQYRMMKHRFQEVLGSEHTHILEEVKGIENLRAKLEYEINGLESKVFDVDDGVIQLERQVVELEQKADELETQLNAGSWTSWIFRTVASIRTGSGLFLPAEI
ncbi:putative sin3 complex subunit protein [Erysiphe neolycopersici]|uniref:Putative sin3 complex subunit protein n=1 Tax=Erysiphe neolycopersici TaxID=212602 RepID=A0A420I017_9PEZI|nr:putative sin3 complex subunit protein [Erysiphe neolycopersici]